MRRALSCLQHFHRKVHLLDAWTHHHHPSCRSFHAIAAPASRCSSHGLCMGPSPLTRWGLSGLRGQRALVWSGPRGKLATPLSSPETRIQCDDPRPGYLPNREGAYQSPPGCAGLGAVALLSPLALRAGLIPYVDRIVLTVPQRHQVDDGKSQPQGLFLLVTHFFFPSGKQSDSGVD